MKAAFEHLYEFRILDLKENDPALALGQAT